MSRRKPQRRFAAYDVETTGINLGQDQILQVALTFTDEALSPIESSVLYGRPRCDLLPDPGAFLVHGIRVEDLYRDGRDEIYLANALKSYFLNANGVVSHTIMGYNNIRFDDVMLRNLFYRNLLDPYDHESRGGNRRLDVFRMVQLAYAFCPEVLKWPRKEDGSVSFKLENLAKENGIDMSRAHDAANDVRATIDLARVIRDNNQKFFDYCHDVLCVKQNVMAAIVQSGRPYWAVDRSLDVQERPRYATVAFTVGWDVGNENRALCVDLTKDPQIILEMQPDQIAEALFSSRKDRGVDEPIPGALAIATNKMPLVIGIDEKGPPKTWAKTHNIDYKLCLERVAYIKRPAVRAKMQSLLKAAFDASTRLAPESDYAYGGLYTGFIKAEDTPSRAELLRVPREEDQNAVMPVLRSTKLVNYAQSFLDRPRHFDLALRAKWVNYGKDIALAGEEDDGFCAYELAAFNQFLQQRFFGERHHNKDALNLVEFEQRYNEACIQASTEEDHIVLGQLRDHVDRVLTRAKFFNSRFEKHRETALNMVQNNPQAVSLQEERMRMRRDISKQQAAVAQRNVAEAEAVATPEAPALDR